LFYLRTLPWFAWPAWLLALAALWRAGRRGWREPAILLPVTLLGVTLIALTGASDARQAYALPLLPPLALLAVPGARALPPLVERGLHGLGVALFALLGALLWLGWLALEHGMPARLTDYLMELTPPPAPAASTLALSVAVLFSAGWVVATLALRRHPQRALLSWSLGAALVLGLSMTLWIGRLDAAKSYRGVMASLDEALPPSHGCIASEGLGEPQRALLEYYAGVRTLRRRVHPRADCDLLLRQEQAGEAPAPGRKAWRVIWEGARSGDRNEQFRLYQRAPEGFPP
jgi:4-amino-4-deoxy-L-arabinose transferase-like glycosyltransferase